MSETKVTNDNDNYNDNVYVDNNDFDINMKKKTKNVLTENAPTEHMFDTFNEDDKSDQETCLHTCHCWCSSFFAIGNCAESRRTLRNPSI